MRPSVRLAVVILLACSAARPSSGVEDEPVYKKTKREEEKKSFIPIERAQEIVEYESYLHEKQDEQDRLRGVSETESRLRELREGHVHKEKGKEKEPLPQQEFLKEKLKHPQGLPAKSTKEKTLDEREEEKPVKKVFALPSPPQVKSLEEEMKKVNRFYEARLLIDYRSLEQKMIKERRVFEPKEKWVSPSAQPTGKESLDEVPFLRETSLFPYAFEGEDFP